MILVFTRFSVLNKTGFRHRTPFQTRVSRQAWLPRKFKRRVLRNRKELSVNDVAKILYAPSRMEQRFFYFKNICLPSLANQTFQDFRHVVLTSPEMPKTYADRLKALQSRFRFEIAEIAADQDMSLVGQRLAAQASTDSDVAVTCRLDDDDALARDFLDRVAGVSRRMMTPGVISFTNGIQMRFDDDDVSATTLPFPFNSVGMSYVQPANDTPHTILDCGAHHMVSHRYNCVTLPDKEAYILLTHIENHSQRFVAKRHRGVDPVALDHAYFSRQFGIDLGLLSRKPQT